MCHKAAAKDHHDNEQTDACTMAQERLNKGHEHSDCKQGHNSDHEKEIVSPSELNVRFFLLLRLGHCHPLLSLLKIFIARSQWRSLFLVWVNLKHHYPENKQRNGGEGNCN